MWFMRMVHVHGFALWKTNDFGFLIKDQQQKIQNKKGVKIGQKGVKI